MGDPARWVPTENELQLINTLSPEDKQFFYQINSRNYLYMNPDERQIELEQYQFNDQEQGMYDVLYDEEKRILLINIPFPYLKFYLYMEPEEKQLELERWMFQNLTNMEKEMLLNSSLDYRRLYLNMRPSQKRIGLERYLFNVLSPEEQRVLNMQTNMDRKYYLYMSNDGRLEQLSIWKADDTRKTAPILDPYISICLADTKCKEFY